MRLGKVDGIAALEKCGNALKMTQLFSLWALKLGINAGDNLLMFFDKRSIKVSTDLLGDDSVPKIAVCFAEKMDLHSLVQRRFRIGGTTVCRGVELSGSKGTFVIAQLVSGGPISIGHHLVPEDH